MPLMYASYPGDSVFPQVKVVPFLPDPARITVIQNKTELAWLDSVILFELIRYMIVTNLTSPYNPMPDLLFVMGSALDLTMMVIFVHLFDHFLSYTKV